MKTLQVILISALLSVIGTVLAERSEPIVIDVRTPEEFAAGHLPGARNINFDRIADQIGLVTEDRQRQIIVYCQSGRRSGFAKQTLETLGYTNVLNAGGVRDVLRAAGREPAHGPDCETREC